MPTVAEIMSCREVQFNYIDGNATVLEALSVMKCENLSYLIVTEYDKFIGIFSENDYARKLVLFHRHSHNTLVKDVMSKDLPFVSSEYTAEECLQIMKIQQTKYLPVFDEFEFKGVISYDDLLEHNMGNENKLKMYRHSNSPLFRNYWI